jgi:DNA replicative helicase MCM subunit Mcm2 (Cdc46/Mcm family)
MLKQYYLQVDVSHLINYNADLANKLTNAPAEHLPLVKCACMNIVRAAVTDIFLCILVRNGGQGKR